jgi:hypothetical protein
VTATKPATKRYTAKGADFGSSQTADGFRPYRYTLRRQWQPRWDSAHAGETVAWIMLNPSTADAEQDDPTIRRCVTFSDRWGYSSLVILNLFAWRSTDPRQLVGPPVEAVVGPENDAHIEHACGYADAFVVAWGTDGALHSRDRAVLSILWRMGRQAWCLGKTRGNHPRHPLYVRGDTQPLPYP